MGSGFGQVATDYEDVVTETVSRSGVSYRRVKPQTRGWIRQLLEQFEVTSETPIGAGVTRYELRRVLPSTPSTERFSVPSSPKYGVSYDGDPVFGQTLSATIGAGVETIESVDPSPTRVYLYEGQAPAVGTKIASYVKGWQIGAALGGLTALGIIIWRSRT